MGEWNFKKVAVVGSGSWGTAVASVFATNGHSTTIWGRDEAVIKSINESHTNSKYLPNIELPHNLKATSKLDELLESSDLIVCAIPTQQIRSVFLPHAARINHKPILNTSKGIEENSLERISEIFNSISPSSVYAILSGPSFAKEVVQNLVTAITVACPDETLCSKIQEMMSNSYFRVYTSNDVAGVEIAGALKNVIAIAAGISAGLNLGYNAQAAIINRGVGEILKIGSYIGAKPMTFLGLAGMGDLILTCTGSLSRNRRFGIAFGEGKSLEEARTQLGGVAEGYYTTHSAYQLTVQKKIEAPITEQIYHILYEGRSPVEAIKQLMSRAPKPELEF